MLSSSRAVWMSALVVLGVIAFILGKKKNVRKKELLRSTLAFLDEMSSIYPSLFLLMVAAMASVYASVQNFVPEFWQEFYFHPTLNPLVLPPVMATLVVLLWLVVITFLAVVDEVYHHYYFVPGITYLAKLCGMAMFVYLIISWATLFYVGYPLLAVLAYFLLKKVIEKFRKF
jgi:hypothetical protein